MDGVCRHNRTYLYPRACPTSQPGARRRRFSLCSLCPSPKQVDSRPQFANVAGAISECSDGHFHAFKSRDEKIGQRDVIAEFSIASVLKPEVLSPGQDQRVIVVVVRITIAAAVQHQRVI